MSSNELIENERKDEDLNEMVGFAGLGLAEPVYQAIKDLGFETPSKIQEKAIPVPACRSGYSLPPVPVTSECRSRPKLILNFS